MENNEIGDIIANDKHEHEYQMIMSNRHMISGIMPDWMIRRYCRDFNMISPFEDHNLKPGVISSGLGSYTYDIRLGWSFKVFTPVYCGEVNPKNFDPNVFVEINTSNSTYCHWRPLAEDTKDSTMHYECVWCGGDLVTYECVWCGGDLVTPVGKPPKDKKCPLGGHVWEPFKAGSWERCKLCKQVVSNRIYAKPECPNAKNKGDNSILIPPNSFALAQSIEWFDVPRDTLILCLGKSTYARCGIVVNVTPLEPGWRGRVTIEISNTTPLPARVFSNEGIAALLFFRTLANCDRDYAQKRGIYQDQDNVEGPRVRKQ
jgi:deoxycytidine triphosphate deaminase